MRPAPKPARIPPGALPQGDFLPVPPGGTRRALDVGMTAIPPSPNANRQVAGFPNPFLPPRRPARGNRQYPIMGASRPGPLGGKSCVRRPLAFAEFAETLANLGIYWLATNRPPRG